MNTSEQKPSLMRRIWENPRARTVATGLGVASVPAVLFGLPEVLSSPEGDTVCDTVVVNGENIVTPLQIAGEAAVRAEEEGVTNPQIGTAADQIPNFTNIGDAWLVCYGPGGEATAERTTHPLLEPTSSATPQN